MMTKNQAEIGIGTETAMVTTGLIVGDQELFDGLLGALFGLRLEPLIGDGLEGLAGSTDAGIGR
jgi:hypothetical protein